MTHRDIILRHTKAFPQWFINGQCLTWASGDGTDQFLQYSTPSEVPGAEALASGSHVPVAHDKKKMFTVLHSLTPASVSGDKMNLTANVKITDNHKSWKWDGAL